MQIDNLVVLVTLLALLTYFWTSLRAGAARGKHHIAAPSVVGHPEFERAYRVQLNTLEWLPLFLPSLWLFAYYWNGQVASGIGLIWIVGRIVYGVTYVKDPAKRGLGFGIQAACTAVLLFGSLGKAAYLIVSKG